MGAYHFLYVVGEKVPDWETWSTEHHINTEHWAHARR
jgi:hypothetical protein